MARRRAEEPLRFSEHFGIDAAELDEYGAFDVSLDRDERLLIDPKLLDGSAVPEMEAAYADVHERFAGIMRLLQRSRREGDALWRSAFRLFEFPEFRAAGLGYSRHSTQGRGWGEGDRERTLRTAFEIIGAGVEDPTLFELAGLLEEGIGADHVSDMFGTLLAPRLALFTKRICRDLGIDLVRQRLAGSEYNLPMYEDDDGNRRPIVLVPEDILSKLPLAMDRDEIGEVMAANEELRSYVNGMIGTTWLYEAKKSIAVARRVFRDPRVLRSVITLYKDAEAKRYDFASDPARRERLQAVVESAIAEEPLEINVLERTSPEDVFDIVGEIIDDFRHKVENNRLRTALFVEGKPRSENVFQAVFQLAAQIHCDYNDLDISPETNIGRGAVDFKFSRGSRRKILVELKLAGNSKLIAGYEAQVKTYEEAERTPYSYYVVLDDGKHDKQLVRLREIASADAEKYDDSPGLVIIDGRRRKSASQL